VKLDFLPIEKRPLHRFAEKVGRLNSLDTLVTLSNLYANCGNINAVMDTEDPSLDAAVKPKLDMLGEIILLRKWYQIHLRKFRIQRRWKRRGFVTFKRVSLESDWWRCRDLNPGHCGYEPHALTN
jgi:hypothetical protein